MQPGGGGAEQLAAQALVAVVVQHIERLDLALGDAGSPRRAHGGEADYPAVDLRHQHRGAGGDACCELHRMPLHAEPGQIGRRQQPGIGAAPRRHVHRGDGGRVGEAGGADGGLGFGPHAHEGGTAAPATPLPPVGGRPA